MRKLIIPKGTIKKQRYSDNTVVVTAGKEDLAYFPQSDIISFRNTHDSGQLLVDAITNYRKHSLMPTEMMQEIQFLKDKANSDERTNGEIINAERSKKEALQESVINLLGLFEAWPLQDVLKKLDEAATILLQDKNYDGNGWEEISHSSDKAKEYVALIIKLQTSK